MKTPEDYVHDIQEACRQLGWCIAMDESEDEINGLLIGNLDYLQEVVSQLHDSEEYCIGTIPSDEQQH